MEQNLAPVEEKSLTASETVLLEYLSTPESVNQTVIAICEHCAITTQTYYRAFKKDWFIQRLHDEAVGLVHSSVLPILHKAKENAIGPLPTSHHWARMLLEMSGIYSPSKSAQVKTDIKVIINMPRPDGASKIIDITPTEERA